MRWRFDDAARDPAPLGATKGSLAAEARLVARRVRDLVDAGACAAGEVGDPAAGRSPTCRSSSARCRRPGSRRCPAPAAGGGAGARCWTSPPTSVRWPTRATSSRCWGLLASPLVGAVVRRAGAAGDGAGAPRSRAMGSRRGSVVRIRRRRRARPAPAHGRPRAAGRVLPVVRRRAARRAQPRTRTSSSSARSRAAPTTSTCSHCPTASGAWPTCASCSAWRRPTRAATGATCAASSTTPAPSSTPPRPRPTRPSTAATRTRCGS